MLKTRIIYSRGNAELHCCHGSEWLLALPDNTFDVELADELNKSDDISVNAIRRGPVIQSLIEFKSGSTAKPSETIGAVAEAISKVFCSPVTISNAKAKKPL